MYLDKHAPEATVEARIFAAFCRIYALRNVTINFANGVLTLDGSVNKNEDRQLAYNTALPHALGYYISNLIKVSVG